MNPDPRVPPALLDDVVAVEPDQQEAFAARPYYGDDPGERDRAGRFAKAANAWVSGDAGEREAAVAAGGIVDEAIAASDPLPAETTLYRGFKINLYREPGELARWTTPGEVIEVGDTPLATTARPDYAELRAMPQANKHGIILELDVPAGTPALDIAAAVPQGGLAQQEAEFVLPRGGRIEIVAAEPTDDPAATRVRARLIERDEQFDWREVDHPRDPLGRFREKIGLGRARLGAPVGGVRDTSPSPPARERRRLAAQAARDFNAREVVDSFGESSALVHDTRDHYGVVAADREEWEVTDTRRARLHDDLARSVLAGVGRPEGRRPRAAVIAGGGGIGKSAIKGEIGLGEENAAIVDVDVIGKEPLPEFAEAQRRGLPDGAFRVHEQSSHIARLALAEGLDAEVDTVLDKVGGSSGWFDQIEDMRERGTHEIEIHVGVLGLPTAVRRAEIRAEETGRELDYGQQERGHRMIAGAVDRIVALDLPVTFWDMRAFPPTPFAKVENGAIVGDADAIRAWQESLA